MTNPRGGGCNYFMSPCFFRLFHFSTGKCPGKPRKMGLQAPKLCKTLWRLCKTPRRFRLYKDFMSPDFSPVLSPHFSGFLAFFPENSLKPEEQNSACFYLLSSLRNGRGKTCGKNTICIFSNTPLTNPRPLRIILWSAKNASVAQSVEQLIRNALVAGQIEFSEQ